MPQSTESLFGALARMLHRTRAWLALAVLTVLTISLVRVTSAQAVTFRVNTTNDLIIGTCDLEHCSLREAIIAANAATGSDTITFNIPGAAIPVRTINVTSALPAITEAVIIDGYSQPGASANTQFVGNDAVLLIEINGAAAGEADGLILAGGASTVRGLVINNFAQYGIGVSSGAGGSVIEGNFIGTNATGTAARPNLLGGISLSDVSNVSIGGAANSARNLISGNGNDDAFIQQGVLISGVDGATGNVIRNNYIGTNAAGTAALGNDGNGVSIFNGNADGNTVIENVISGNTDHGIDIAFGADSNVVRGNRIGTDANSDNALPNNGNGVLINTPFGTDGTTNNTIGGATLANRNIISGNGGNGVRIDGALTSDNTVSGNAIGLDGESSPSLPNGFGVVIAGGANNNTIGGATIAARNSIAGNIGDGIAVIDSGTNRNAIRNNGLWNNSDLGIDLNNDGVTANDTGDFDTGPNNLQNFPVIASATISGGNLMVTFSLAVDADAAPAPRTIEFFEADSAAGGEGRFFLGATTSSDSSPATASLGSAAALGVVAGDPIVAAATDFNGNTSEFSAVVIVTVTGGASTLTVNANNDVNDGACNGTHCSLREAINAANANAITDTIAFNIGGGGVQTITVAAVLPAVTQPVVIDGVTQPGFTGAPLIVLNGASAGPAANGLTLDNGGSTVRELVINGFAGDGIVLFTDGNHLIEGNYIGTTATGLAAAGNGRGIAFVVSGGNTISGNVISGNAGDGLYIAGAGSSNNRVVGNLIGVNASGTAALGNSSNGVLILSAFNNRVGGLTPAERNVISGNGIDGVQISGAAATGNLVQGNFIGTNAGGTAVLGNTFTGVSILNASGNTIGGAAPGARNLMSGNQVNGVYIIGPDASNNLVLGNYIGTDVAGNADLGNGFDGVAIREAANNRIGGPTAAERNLISGNDQRGVLLFQNATTNTVQGNYIGVNAAGMADLGNAFNGILLTDSSGNTLGGPAAGAGNLVSGNDFAGINLFGSSNNLLQGNVIGLNATGTLTLTNPVVGLTIQDSSLNNTVLGNTLSGNGNAFEGGLSILRGSNGNVVQGNRFGTDASGEAAFGNNGPGVYIFESDNNMIGGTGEGQANVIANNVQEGVRVLSGVGNRIRGNTITNNGELGIDLTDDGVTLNDAGDADTGANGLQNFPILISTTQGRTGQIVEGALNGSGLITYTVDLYSNPVCDASGNGEGQTYLGSVAVPTDEGGNATFSANIGGAEGFVTATATDPNGNTSEFSQCALIGPDNTAWTRALDLNLPDTALATGNYSQLIDKQGQTRWYRFEIAPGSTLTLTLTGLETAYDFTVYKDIAVAYSELISTTDTVTDTLNQLGAEFAPDIYSPDIYSPDIYSPDIYSPDIYSPDIYSPDIYSPDIYSPDIYSPDIYSPDIYSPDIYSPDIYSPEDYASAQQRSLVAVSPYNGTAQHGIAINTWNNAGNYYLRVRGRNGAFSLTDTYTVTVTRENSTCPGVTPPATPTSLTATGPNFRSLIVADWARMTGTAQEIATLQARLAALAARAEVGGVVVNVGADARVVAANTVADANPLCPYAKNIVADAVKRVVDRYRAANPELRYIVLVGGDSAIPFFRYPDRAGLAPESNYIPPVNDTSASEASLRLNYVLGQDAYGAATQISTRDDVLPIPGLAVGRLVETAAEATTVVDAYIAANGIITPTTSFVSGYDFLAKTARAVSEELRLGTNATPDELIAEANVLPTDPGAWTADQLRARLFARRNDLVFLAGHFSGSSALAADYATRMLAEEIITAPVSFTNSIVWSAGCHSGYNIVDGDSTAVTRQPDWAQAFARRGATLVAGTGYQYGDTDFIYYSEALYLNFSQQLRTGVGPVSVGEALVRAKQAYLTTTGPTRGIHEKSYLIATLFGLPMLQVNVPGTRLTPPEDESIVGSPATVGADPGETLGLRTADVSIDPNATVLTRQVQTSSGLQTVTYISGTNGVAVNPAEPVMPLSLFNVTVSDSVLRGVGFRGGAYTDLNSVRPLVSEAVFDLSGARPDFNSPVFYPVRVWRVNYFDALDGGDVTTRLMLMPAQFRTANGSLGILRRFTGTQFRLFYSNNLTTYATPGGGNTPGLSMPPAIAEIESSVVSGQVRFRIRVSGDPAAGMQAVWITYTGESAAGSGTFYGQWQSLDLARDPGDSRVWIGSLPLGANDPADVRFIVQAANGVGLVTLATNSGAYYVPGADNTPAPPQNANAAPTSLQFINPPASGTYGDTATFNLRLTRDAAPLANATVQINIGPTRRTVQTNAAGEASAVFPLTMQPAQYTVSASFAGDVTSQSASASTPFTVNVQPTTLALIPANVTTVLSATSTMTATLRDGSGAPLLQKSVVFVVTGAGGSFSALAETNNAGQVVLGAMPLPAGTYTVNAYFGSVVTLPGGAVLNLTDDRYGASTATGALTIRPPFPTTPVLDNFNRRNGALGGNWRGSTGTHQYVINSNKVRVAGGGPLYWNGPNPVFGANQEAYVTLSQWSATALEQALFLKVQAQPNGTPNWQRGVIGVHFDRAAGVVRVETYRPGQPQWTVYANDVPVALQFGDRLGAQVLATGEVLIFRNGVQLASVTLNAADRSFFNSKGGRIGLYYSNAGESKFDDFGGGTFVP
ncbi:MAG: right-handed parallel beta-helix repeat-containing protein [Anaerolineales bacterium]